jgi:ABC-type molybdenum transport system ATPase subunit/photorepair protein PhrA
MDILTQVADKLAQEVLKVERETGNEDLVEEIKKVIGASSTTLEEAYMTAIRVRRAEARARALLDDIRRATRENG